MLNKGELDAETTVVDPKTSVALSNISTKHPNKNCVGFNMAVGLVIVGVGGVQNSVFVVGKEVVLVLMLGIVFVFKLILVR